MNISDVKVGMKVVMIDSVGIQYESMMSRFIGVEGIVQLAEVNDYVKVSFPSVNEWWWLKSEFLIPAPAESQARDEIQAKIKELEQLLVDMDAKKSKRVTMDMIKPGAVFKWNGTTTGKRRA